MEGTYYINIIYKKASSVTWDWEEKGERTQEPPGEHEVLLCKLGFSSRNQQVTGSIPFLNIAQRHRYIQQQKIQVIKTFSRRWDNCIIYKQENHKWAIEALQNKYWCRIWFCTSLHFIQMLLFHTKEKILKPTTVLTAFDFTPVWMTIHYFRCHVVRLKSNTSLILFFQERAL